MDHIKGSPLWFSSGLGRCWRGGGHHLEVKEDEESEKPAPPLPPCRTLLG